VLSGNIDCVSKQKPFYFSCIYWCCTFWIIKLDHFLSHSDFGISFIISSMRDFSAFSFSFSLSSCFSNRIVWLLRAVRFLVISSAWFLTVCSKLSLVLCKSSIYRFLLVSDAHPLCQKSSTCISRVSFSSL